MKLRENQKIHLDKTIMSVGKYRRTCAQLPTGGGKTVEFAFCAKRFIEKTNQSVAIFVHRQELLNQAARTIKRITGIAPVIIDRNARKRKEGLIYIIMVDSYASRIAFVRNVGLVIIDECHIANFNKIHSQFADCLIIGYTATPISSSKKEPLNKYFSDIVCGPQVGELIKLKSLSQNVTRVPETFVDKSSLTMDRFKQDYDERKMSDEYKKPLNVHNVAKNYMKYCKGQKTMIFNVNISHSKEVEYHLSLFGINCRHVDATSEKTPSIRVGFKNEREEIIDWFKHTHDAVLLNVMIATVGFDEPTIKWVILNFSTTSLAKFMQTTGRGGRVIDEDLAETLGVSPKDNFGIIDLGNNYERFGDWSDDRDWKYIFNNPDKPADGIAPKKICPECEGLVHASKMVCDCKKEDGDECGYEWSKKQVGKEEDLGELIVVTKNIDIEELVRQNKQSFEFATFLQLGEIVVNQMFKTASYSTSQIRIPTAKEKEAGFKEYYRLCSEWFLKYAAGKDGNPITIDGNAWYIRRARANFNRIIENKTKILEL